MGEKPLQTAIAAPFSSLLVQFVAELARRGSGAYREKEKGVVLLSAFLAEKWQTQKFGRGIVFSAALCYNGITS